METNATNPDPNPTANAEATPLPPAAYLPAPGSVPHGSAFTPSPARHEPTTADLMRYLAGKPGVREELLAALGAAPAITPAPAPAAPSTLTEAELRANEHEATSNIENAPDQQPGFCD